MEIRFPASTAFDSVANVAASNIAFRLNYKTKTVKRLRGAVDAATEALGGAGNTKMSADWHTGPLGVTLSNSKAKIGKDDVQELKDILTELGATEVSVKASSVSFTIEP
jgi:hypothetical protein